MKKRSVSRTAVVFIILALPCSLFAQWEPTNGPYGGSVEFLTVLDSIIFAGSCHNGFFTGIDNGTQWMRADSAFSKNTQIFCLASSGNHVLAGAFSGSRHGLFVSPDKGGSWIPSVTGLAPEPDVKTFAVSVDTVTDRKFDSRITVQLI